MNNLPTIKSTNQVQSKQFKLNTTKYYLNRITSFYINNVKFMKIIKTECFIMKLFCHIKQSLKIRQPIIIFSIQYPKQDNLYIFQTNIVIRPPR